jgi:protein required for attachment to host cells
MRDARELHEEELMTTASWIVLADRHHARIYVQWRRNAPLVLLEELEHIEAKAKPRDIVSDRPGVREGGGELPRGNATVPHTDRDEVEENRFMRMLADRLDQGRSHQEFSELVFIMPPRTFGRVMEALQARTADLVVEHIPRNYLNLADSTLAARIEQLTEMHPATTQAARARRNATQARALPKTGARRPQDGRTRGVKNAPKGRLR